jgi:hypothetical protein
MSDCGKSGRGRPQSTTLARVSLHHCDFTVPAQVQVRRGSDDVGSPLRLRSADFQFEIFSDRLGVWKPRSKDLINWTQQQIALAKRWPSPSALLEQIRNKEIRSLNTFEQISLLCGSADYNRPPYAPKPYSGWWNSSACL